MKVGFGWDIHRLERGGDLVIGGVVVSKEFHAIAHSDGDVLCHAIADALIGIVFEKDIGEIFPEVEDNRNMNSISALSKVARSIGKEGFRIVNVDCVVVLSNIKLSPFREMIVENLKNALGCDNVSVKFKSGNGVGEVGSGNAIEAFSVVLLEEIV